MHAEKINRFISTRYRKAYAESLQVCYPPTNRPKGKQNVKDWSLENRRRREAAK